MLLSSDEEQKSEFHAHQSNEYESFLTWMAELPYHDYREGENFSQRSAQKFWGQNIDPNPLDYYTEIAVWIWKLNYSEGVEHWAIIFNIVILFTVFMGILYGSSQTSTTFGIKLNE